ncbi:glycosyltransferase family 4 protein [Isoptericola sp. NPDC057559]|uniref:glycosyltransferase family 4 protein n=1 Tax=Isoptericola sp. NPDC057559 TaxID=3346168 RepID=UPI0036969E91
MAVGVGTGSHLHVITPGDHFSPATGSALPTVVHGLAGATPAGAPRSVVVVARGTYADRYPSADVVEYTAVAPRRTDRYRDAVSARVGLPRAATRRALAATLADQWRWPPSVVLGHNLPQLVPLVDGRRHAAVLYAHNELLRTYSVREAGRVLDGAGALVCVSDFVADRTADRLPARLRGRVRVVRNAVDTTLFRPADGVPPTEGPLRVVFVGRTVADKGPDVLVDALVRLRRTDVVATLVGTPHFAPGAPLTRYERELRAAAAPLGDSVRWLPFQPRAEVAALMRAADVVVVPSRWAEPFALTVLEGMASGAAVVAARVGGIPEAAGGAGLIVPPDSPGALAEALEGLADDRALLAEVRARGLRHARANDWSTARRRLDRALWDLGLTSAAPAGTSFR